MNMHYSMPSTTPRIFRREVQTVLRRTIGSLAVVALMSNIVFHGYNLAGGSAKASSMTEPGYSDSNSTATTTNTLTVTPVANPALGQSCGLDIGLVVDTSGSVDGTEMTQQKNALTSFVDAFTGTSTQFSLVKFNTDSSLVQSFTADATVIKGKISSLPSTGSGNTNWDSGLARSFDSFGADHKNRAANPDLIVIATDGSPNRTGYPTATAALSPFNLNWAPGLSAATTRANTIKTAGTRVVAIGIGGDPSDPAYPNTDYKLQAISGATIAPPAPVNATTDVIKTDFSKLGASMAELANGLCGGHVKVIKHVVGGTATAANWTMHVGQAATLAGSETGTTKDVAAGTYTISETGGPDNYVASFSGDCNSSGQLSVAGGETKMCTVTNTYVPPTVCHLELTKAVDTTSAKPGDVVTYTLTYKNTGTANCTGGGVRIDDTIPAGLTYNGVHTETVSNDTGHDGIRYGYQYADFGQPVNDNLQAGATNVSWNANIVSPGESGVITFKTTVNTMTACTTGTASNTARISSDQTYPPAITSNAVATTLTAACNGTLNLIKQAVGGTETSASWQMHVKQNGQDVTGSPKAGSLGGSTYNLPAGTYQISETGPSGYAASFSNSCANGTIAVTAGQSVTCTVTNTVVPVYAISLIKHGPTSVNAGDNITYTLDWSIGGNTAVTQAVLTDPIPVHTTFVSADNGGTQASGVVTWNLGTKNPADHGTVTVVVKSDSPLTNGTLITNTGTFDTAETAPVLDTVETRVSSTPTIALDKQGPATILAGQQMTYSLAWSVSGNSPVTNAVLTDPIPANTTFVSADNGGTQANGLVTWNLGSKNPGDSGTVKLTVNVAGQILNGTVLTNTATFDTTETDAVKDTVTTTVASAPTLSIVKTNNVTTFTNPGKTVTYTVSVTNAATATDTAKAVIVTDVLPSGFVFVNGGGSTKAFALGDMVPGKTLTFSYDAAIAGTVSAGTYTNTATAKGANTTDVSAKSNVEVRIPFTLGVSAEPKLSITKTINHSTANPGNILVYTISVKNTGDAMALNVKIVDELPVGLTDAKTGLTTTSWFVPTIAVGHTKVVAINVRVSATAKAGKLQNVATASADGVDPVKAKATVTIKVPQVLGLATTGAGPRDYGIMAFGLILMIGGVLLVVRNRKSEDLS